MTTATTAAPSKAASGYPNVQLHIDGQWCDAADGRTMAVFNPADGSEIGRLAHAGRADLDRALAAAQKGFEAWRQVPAHERAALMRKASQLFRERADDTARALTLEQGKPLMEAKGEVLAACDVIEWMAEEGRRTYGRIVPPRDLRGVAHVTKHPVGPVAAFTPWNFPVNQVVRKLGAALATGNSIIVKAPEETPASPAALIRAFADAGLPAGVVQLVYGVPAEISQYLIPHPVIRKITFTGSTPVGKQLAALAGQHMKRATMELGGHAPVIVCEDADIDLAIKAAGAAKFRNAGQVCISPTRFLVARPIAAEFTRKFAAQAEKLAVGDGLLETTRMGPLANERRVSAMQALTEDAVQRGGTVAAGGKKIGSAGNFWAPTVLADVPLSANVFHEEPFGPMAVVHAFDTLEQALTEANRLPYGLAGYAFTQSLKSAHQIAQRLEVGLLWINQGAAAWPELPFGGVKDSGYGSEGGPEALEAYLTTKSVSIMCG